MTSSLNNESFTANGNPFERETAATEPFSGIFADVSGGKDYTHKGSANNIQSLMVELSMQAK